MAGIRRAATIACACVLVAAASGLAFALWLAHDPPEWWLFNTRGRWKSTLGTLREAAAALDCRARIHDATFPVADGELALLRKELEGECTRHLRHVDGWGRPLVYRSDGRTYEVRSLGRDGRKDPPDGSTPVADQDLILRDGQFVENDIFQLMQSDKMTL